MKNFSSDFNKYLKSNKIDESQIKRMYKTANNIYVDEQPTNVFDRLIQDRILILSGEVNEYSTEILKANMLYLESISDDDITLYINSGGGEVYSGLGLIDVMEFIKPDIITINTGLAASMGAVILSCGTKGKRKALKRSRTMIHQPLGGAWGQASDMEIDTKEIITLKKELYEIIADRSGQTYDKVYNDSDRDYWMTAAEALRYGMIDEIITKR